MSLTKKQLQEARQLMAAKGGQAGGPARAKALSKKQRSDIARKAGLASWGKDSKRKLD